VGRGVGEGLERRRPFSLGVSRERRGSDGSLFLIGGLSPMGVVKSPCGVKFAL